MSLRVEILPVTPFRQNCSVIWCSETKLGAVIDPGGDVAKIKNIMQKFEVILVQILLTHGHLDHAGGASELAVAFDIPIIGPHEADLFWLQSIELQSKKLGFSGGKNCCPNKWLNDSDVIAIGNEELQVLHCPGHTPGHVVFYHRNSKLAFVGDVLFKGSIGRTDFPKGDQKTLISSIVEKLWPLGGDTRFISGHGAMSNFAQERQNNLFVSDNALL